MNHIESFYGDGTARVAHSEPPGGPRLATPGSGFDTTTEPPASAFSGHRGPVLVFKLTRWGHLGRKAKPQPSGGA